MSANVTRTLHSAQPRALISRRDGKKQGIIRGIICTPIKPKLSHILSSSCRSRREKVIIGRVRTGHRMRPMVACSAMTCQTQCPGCGSSQTVKRVIVNCSQLDTERWCFGMSSSQLTLTTVLRDDSIPTGVDALLKFLAAARLSVLY